MGSPMVSPPINTEGEISPPSDRLGGSKRLLGSPKRLEKGGERINEALSVPSEYFF